MGRSAPVVDCYTGTGSTAAEERLGHSAVAGHSESNVACLRFDEQSARPSAIAASVAIEQHHRVEAIYLGPLQPVREMLRLLRCHTEVLLRSLPLPAGSGCGSGDRLTEARNRPYVDRPGLQQLKRKRIELGGLFSFAQRNQALDDQQKHVPGARVVGLLGAREDRTVLVQERERAAAIAFVGLLAKQGADDGPFAGAGRGKVVRQWCARLRAWRLPRATRTSIGPQATADQRADGSDQPARLHAL